MLAHRKIGVGIFLIDRNPYHVYAPVLFEIANAYVPWEKEAVGKVLTTASTAPYKYIFDGTGVNYFQATISHLDAKNRVAVMTDGEKMTADYLVLTLGSHSHIGSVQGAREHAFFLKDLNQAIELRSHVISLFLQYRSSASQDKQKYFTFVISGGGCTGIEYAAELALFLQKLCRLHRVDGRRLRIILFEKNDRILRGYSEELGRKAHERLKKLGVEVRLRTEIVRIAAEEVELGSGEIIPACTTVCFSGVRAHDLLLRSDYPVHVRGGLYVNPNMEVWNHPNVFAAGDCVYAEDPVTKMVAPDVAWAGLQQAKVVAENIARRIDQAPLISYYCVERPLLLAVGGKFAIARIPPYVFSGIFAWFIKQFTELMYLWAILPNFMAVKYWLKSLRVKVVNDN